MPVGRFANCRAELDGLLLPLVTGSTTVLPSLPQKAAFLNALQPRDRLRLLGMVKYTVIHMPASSLAAHF